MRVSTDKATAGQVDLNREQQKYAIKLDNVADEFGKATNINKKAADAFKAAVDTFEKILNGEKGKAATGPNAVAKAEEKANQTMTTAQQVIADPNATKQDKLKAAQAAFAARKNASELASGERLGAAPAITNKAAQSSRSEAAATDSRRVDKPTTRGVTARSVEMGTNKSDKASDAIDKLIKFQGDSLGNKSHFDMLDSEVRDNFTQMISEYGKPVQVNAAHRNNEEQQSLYDKWVAGGRQGNPVAKPGASKHNIGRALDLNSQQVNELDKMGLLSKYGFNRVAGDPPHIEMANGGGVFEGPASGYQVELHQREAVVPLPNPNSIITVEDNTVSKKPLNTVTATDTAPTASSNTATEDLTSLFTTMMQLMEDKFDSLINKVGDSNDIQDRILKNSMA